VLATRLQAAWEYLTIQTEQVVKDLWDEVTPCVFVIIPEFFSSRGISALREFHLDMAMKLSNISHATRPNAMNPYGLVLDEQVEGRSVVPLFG
jgi:hypothetical protein